jgi:hypothetical protein
MTTSILTTTIAGWLMVLAGLAKHRLELREWRRRRWQSKCNWRRRAS